MNTIKNAFFVFCIGLALIFGKTNVWASEAVAGSAAQLSSFEPLLVDERLLKLESFLRLYNSPMADEAVIFIREADRYSLDWKLVAAIAGTESTFGKRIPPGSYNGWGWGIPTGAASGIAFSSWQNGIETVSKGLREKYMNTWGAYTIEEIGAIYAASPLWAAHVRFFMEKIASYNPATSDSLTITI